MSRHSVIQIRRVVRRFEMIGATMSKHPSPAGSSVEAQSPRLLSMSQVTALTTYSRPSIYRLVRKGRFPKPIKLGDVKIAFDANEVNAWLRERPRAAIGEAAGQSASVAGGSTYGAPGIARCPGPRVVAHAER